MSEKFYDDEIAPKLADIARLCEAHGMSFVASVEFAPGNTGSTALLALSSCMTQRMTAMASRSDGNVDKLIFSLMTYAREHGHSSICLLQLGVPCAPEQAVRQ